MKIRKAKKEDFEEYFKLEQEYAKYNNKVENNPDLRYKLIKPKIKQNFLKKLKKKNKLFLVLDDGAKLQGYLFGEIEPLTKAGYKFKENNLGYLENVYISKKNRGQGYFELLLKELIKYFKSKKIKYMELDVDSENKLAIKSYQRNKFYIREHKMMLKL